MATQTFTWSPKRLVAGHDPDLITKPATILAGQILAAGTLLESDLAGKMKVHGGTAKVAGVLMHSVNASTGVTDNKGSTTDEYGNPYVALGVAADQPATIWISGDFFADQLAYPVAASTNLLKQKLVEGSMIALTFTDLGEV